MLVKLQSLLKELLYCVHMMDLSFVLEVSEEVEVFNMNVEKSNFPSGTSTCSDDIRLDNKSNSQGIKRVRFEQEAVNRTPAKRGVIKSVIHLIFLPLEFFLCLLSVSLC